MRCPRCGSWNPDSNRFCGHCGSILDATEEIQSDDDQAILRCPNCDAMVLEGESACSSCGYIFSRTRGPVLTSVPIEEERPYPYVVWRFPFTIFETAMMSYDQFVFRSIFAWIAILIIVLTAILKGIWQVALPILAVFLVIYIVSWKKGVEEAVWHREGSQDHQQ